MRASYVAALGEAGSILYGELPDPVPGPGQVLVRTEAVAVDAADTYVRSGGWPTSVSFPLVVGRDLVGAVVAVGAHVSDLVPGQRVWTNSAGYDGRPGATAELVAVARDRLYPLPHGADPVAFVAAVHPGATAYGVLVGRAGLRPGETVVVVGANGAVGSCLVQVAAACKARVVAVVRDPRSEYRLRELGADRVVVADGAWPAGSATAAGADASVSGGVDVLVDTTGQADPGSCVELLAPRGRVVLIAGRRRVQLDVWAFYTREAQLLSFVMSAMTVPELAAAADWINTRHAGRSISVPVGEVLAFRDAADAHVTVESGELPRMSDGTRGRLVLLPDPPP